METQRDTVLDVSLHALENLPSNLYGADYGAQTRSKEYYISRSLDAVKISVSVPAIKYAPLTWAASEAPSTAIPQSDFFKDGASFTPSPGGVSECSLPTFFSNPRKTYQSLRLSALAVVAFLRPDTCVRERLRQNRLPSPPDRAGLFR